MTHKAYLHLDNIYHSPYVIQWWSDLHGRESIAELYRQGKIGEDPVMTYQRMYNLNQQQFNKEMLRGYQHLVNFDFNHARKETRQYACTFNTELSHGDGSYRVGGTTFCPDDDFAPLGKRRLPLFFLSFGRKVYKKLPMDIHSTVTSIAEDEDGGLWVSTMDQGVWLYLPKTEQVKHYADHRYRRRQRRQPLALHRTGHREV